MKNYKKCFKHIRGLKIINLSGFNAKHGGIEVAKKHQYTIIKNQTITGDAPKDFIKSYEYGVAPKAKHDAWTIYIAKLGHKYYPNESITEELIAEIGRVYGFNMVESKLCVLGGQIRFLSKFFNKKNEELVHGADLFAGYLGDKKFVDDVEVAGQSQSFFSIKFTKEVFDKMYDSELAKAIYKEFMRMFFFDALVGNHDMHLYNWGIIRNIFGKNQPKYSPIYDSARGILWNHTEDKIKRIIKEKRIHEYVRKYCENARPKIGLENEDEINHFDIVEKYKKIFANDELIMYIFDKEKRKEVKNEIKLKFDGLISDNRLTLINKILDYRYNRILNILKNTI